MLHCLCETLHTYEIKYLQKKMYYFVEKVVGSVLELSAKKAFYIGQVLIEKYGLKTPFLLINIKKMEKGLGGVFSPLIKLVLLHTFVVLHYTYPIKRHA